MITITGIGGAEQSAPYALATLNIRSVRNRKYCITHRGKPPAMPGDSPGFDLYDGRCEFLISTRRKEIHDERISEAEPYEVGLQVSHCVHTEATKEKSVWILRRQLVEIFHELALHKESKIVERHMMGDHVHMCLSIPPKYAVSNVVGYLKGKSAIQIARKFGGRQKNFTGGLSGLGDILSRRLGWRRILFEHTSATRKRKTSDTIK
jgi:putative transposase